MEVTAVTVCKITNLPSCFEYELSAVGETSGTRAGCWESEFWAENKGGSLILGTYWFQALTPNKACVRPCITFLLLFGATNLAIDAALQLYKCMALQLYVSLATKNR